MLAVNNEQFIVMLNGQEYTGKGCLLFSKKSLILFIILQIDDFCI
jgi:hypothetical protein